MANEPRAAQLFLLRKIPASEMPFTLREDLMRWLSSPFWVYARLMLVILVAQYFLPPLRLGIDVLWDPNARTIVAAIAVLPSFIIGYIRSRQEFKHQMSPTMYTREMSFAALLGAGVSLFGAYALGLPLTVPLAAAWFLLVIVWIAVTIIVSVYISGSIRVVLLRERLERAEEEGIVVPFEQSARMW